LILNTKCAICTDDITGADYRPANNAFNQACEYCRLLSNASVPARIIRASKGYSLSLYSEQIQTRINTFLLQIDASRSWGIIGGKNGRGKTLTALQCLHNHICVMDDSAPRIRVSQMCLWISADEYGKRLGQLYPRQREGIIANDMKGKRFIVLDDMGREPDPELITSVIQRADDSGVQVVFTTNASTEELITRYGNYVWSRICGGAGEALLMMLIDHPVDLRSNIQII